MFISVPGFANWRIVINTTTATPSLNKDSPAILVSKDFDTPALFKMLSTAIGSVGDINAPKSMACIN